MCLGSDANTLHKINGSNLLCKVSEIPNSSFTTTFLKLGKPWPGFGPGTFALPRQRSTRLSYQGADAP
jgi:hypothetical protein